MTRRLWGALAVVLALVLALVLLAVPVTVAAQEATPLPDGGDTPPVIVVTDERSTLDELLPYVVIAAVMVIGFLTVRQQGAQAGAVYYEDALERAELTATPTDDLLVRTAIFLQGYTVAKNADGSYTVTPPQRE